MQDGQDIGETARISIERAARGRGARPMILVGQDREGMACALFEVEAAASRAVCSRIPFGSSNPEGIIRAVEDACARYSARPEAREIAMGGFRAAAGARRGAGLLHHETFELGVADSGDLAMDLSDLFGVIGDAAKACGEPWVLLADELHQMDQGTLGALIHGLHHAGQKGLPISFFATAEPGIHKKAGEARSYAERLFLFTTLETPAPKCEP